MTKPGIYRLYRIHPEDNHRQLIGRFILTISAIYLLEDHHGELHDVIKPGPLTGPTLSRIENMKHSPYFAVVSEEDIEKGLDDDGIDELDLDPGVDWGVNE